MKNFATSQPQTVFLILRKRTSGLIPEYLYGNNIHLTAASAQAEIDKHHQKKHIAYSIVQFHKSS